MATGRVRRRGSRRALTVGPSGFDKGVEVNSKWSDSAAAVEAQMPRDADAKLSLRTDGLEVDLAVEYAIDDGANECGAVHSSSGLLLDLVGEAIELHDLSIEQHHRHLGPRLGMDGWTPSTRSMSALERLPRDKARDHRERV